MWELHHKVGWAPKNWCFGIVVLEKALKSPLDFKEIKPVNPENQHWIFIGRTDIEAEAPIIWPPDVKHRLIGKDPDAGRTWRQRRREQQGMKWFDNITASVDMSLSNFWVLVEDRRTWHAADHGVRKVGHNLLTKQQIHIIVQFNPGSSLKLMWLFRNFRLRSPKNSCYKSLHQLLE